MSIDSNSVDLHLRSVFCWHLKEMLGLFRFLYFNYSFVYYIIIIILSLYRYFMLLVTKLFSDFVMWNENFRRKSLTPNHFLSSSLVQLILTLCIAFMLEAHGDRVFLFTRLGITSSLKHCRLNQMFWLALDFLLISLL